MILAKPKMESCIIIDGKEYMLTDNIKEMEKRDRIEIAKKIWGLETKTRIGDIIDGSQG